MINPDFSTKILFISSDCLGRSPFQAVINLTYLKEISYFPPFGFSFISVADSLCIILHQFLFLSSSSLWTPSVFPDISSIDAYSKHIPSHAYSAVISPAVTLPSKFNIASPLDPEVADQLVHFISQSLNKYLLHADFMPGDVLHPGNVKQNFGLLWSRQLQSSQSPIFKSVQTWPISKKHMKCTYPVYWKGTLTVTSDLGKGKCQQHQSYA